LTKGKKRIKIEYSFAINRYKNLPINIFLTLLTEMTDTKSIESRHISVLLDELVDSININSDRKNIIVDTTL
jgi:hypothetical protein